MSEQTQMSKAIQRGQNLRSFFVSGMAALSLLGASQGFATGEILKSPEESTLKTIGNPAAPSGGTFYRAMKAEPEKLNPLTSTDGFAQILQNFTMDGLATVNAETYEFEPGLAERWEMSKDKKFITFFLRKGATFHDGKPVTAEDVKFSFDAVNDVALGFDTAHARPYFENIAKAEIVDPHTIKFEIKKQYFNNFSVLASGGFMPIVPKHIYSKKEGTNKTLVGSGPYKLENYDKGKAIVLVKNPSWWGKGLARSAGQNNFEKIYFRFIKEDNVLLENLKKGSIDFSGLTPEQFVKQTSGAPWGATIDKQKVENLEPKGFGFVAWNFKNEIFQDKKVRVALAHLMNRELMNEKFRFNMSLPATGPWYVQNPYASAKVKPILFDFEKAKALLKEAGWQDTDQDGFLDKEIKGKKTPFRFSLMFGNRDAEKYYTVYKEDLRKAGIDAKLSLVEWNSFVKALDERKFDAVSLAWSGGSVDIDPKQIWHSASAQPGGSNFNSYSNPEVDKLIDQGREELDRAKRIKIFQQVYEKIAEDAPYAFLFVERYGLYGHTKRMGWVKPTYNYDIGQTYWWITK